jgi:hypothetical protein
MSFTKENLDKLDFGEEEKQSDNSSSLFNRTMSFAEDTEYNFDVDFDEEDMFEDAQD